MEFVAFEVAKKLKEKGFDYPCIGHYVNNHLYITHYQNAFHSDKDESIDAPTISQILKWLREEKELHIEIYMYYNCYLWEIYNTQIYDADLTQKSEKYSEIEYETYEQAARAGIEYTLDNLI
jgi:hypothetical protein